MLVFRVIWPFLNLLVKPRNFFHDFWKIYNFMHFWKVDLFLSIKKWITKNKVCPSDLLLYKHAYFFLFGLMYETTYQINQLSVTISIELLVVHICTSILGLSLDWNYKRQNTKKNCSI